MTVCRLVLLTLCCCLPAAVARSDQPVPVFETDVQPILAAKCGQCHSNTVQKAGLNVSTIQAVVKGGESGEPLISESVDDSLLWIMIDVGGMPPEEEPQLTQDERAVIRLWLESGAGSETPATPTRSLAQHDVQPILLLRCVACHGPRLQQGGLNLWSRETLLQGGDSGPALVAGDPDSSLLNQRIESAACPPRELLLKFFVKRPPDQEVQTLRDWITAGAPEGDVRPDVATTEPDPLVTDQDRRHWAFQPPQLTTSFTSIDDFVQARLREHELTLSPEADRDTLIRRACLDLTGLPPAVQDWQRWRESTAVDWYAGMIDELLSSPQYGERWGRYWLDLAGYADSEGGVSADPVREVAWKYRDYVIAAFNNDTPYDQFLLQQLAGDELIDHAALPEMTQAAVDNLIATGFLRMGIDQTGSRTMNFVPERLGVIDDAIQVVGSGVMGLTLECARCHSHKYDPIPHRDYYRFKAIFQGAFDEHDWLSFKNRFLQAATPQHRQRVADTNPPLLARLKILERDLKQAQADVQMTLLTSHYPDQPEQDRLDTLAALRIADNNRTLTQRNLVEQLQLVEVLPDSDQPPAVVAARQQVTDLEQQIRSVRRQLEPALDIRALWDRGNPSPTYILRRGDHDKPGPPVGPGVPSVLTDGRTPFDIQVPFPDGTSKTGRRLAFARWLTDPDHPLTARVIVNRLWYHHFGAGLVRSLENFGRQSEPPSHPELLDWLAIQLVKNGWSLKALHRLIMNSQTYRQSSRVTELHVQRDPENRLLSRMSLRRMNAEALRDSLLFVSGSLDLTPGGPPDPVTVDRNGQVHIQAYAPGRWRRSVYAQYRRTEIPTMLDTFDYPEMGPNCVARNVSTVAPQSLLLLNNAHVRELAAALAASVEASAPGADGDPFGPRVQRVYQLALSRPPSDDERRLGIDWLQQLETQLDGRTAAALETYCHMILNSAAFLYID